jgi:hypothetical protein
VHHRCLQGIGGHLFVLTWGVDDWWTDCRVEATLAIQSLKSRTGTQGQDSLGIHRIAEQLHSINPLRSYGDGL